MKSFLSAVVIFLVAFFSGSVQASDSCASPECAAVVWVDLDQDGSFVLPEDVPADCRDCAEVLDCDDTNAAIHPGVTEVCDGIDQNCNGLIDEAIQIPEWYPDNDGDSYGWYGLGDGQDTKVLACEAPPGYVLIDGGQDCDDTDPNTYPGAPEICDDIDQDCDGATKGSIDVDGDGYCPCPEVGVGATLPPDCNDLDPKVNPGATETCNSIDDNCDGVVDEGVMKNFYPDADGDGYGVPDGTPIQACAAPPGTAKSTTDCNDADPAIHPGATEASNGIDDNCDGVVDEDPPSDSVFPGGGDSPSLPDRFSPGCSYAAGPSFAHSSGCLVLLLGLVVTLSRRRRM